MIEGPSHQSYADQNFLHRKVLVNNYRKKIDTMRNVATPEGGRGEKRADEAHTWEANRKSNGVTDSGREIFSTSSHQRRSASDGQNIAFAQNVRTEPVISGTSQSQYLDDARRADRRVHSRTSAIYVDSRTQNRNRIEAITASARSRTAHRTQEIAPAVANDGPSRSGPVRNSSSHNFSKPYASSQALRSARNSSDRHQVTVQGPTIVPSHSPRDDPPEEIDSLVAHCAKLEQEVRLQSMQIVTFEEREAMFKNELEKLGSQWNAFHHKEIQKQATSFRDFLLCQEEQWDKDRVRQLDAVHKENQELREKLARADKINALNQQVHERNMDSIDKLLQTRMNETSPESSNKISPAQSAQQASVPSLPLQDPRALSNTYSPVSSRSSGPERPNSVPSIHPPTELPIPCIKTDSQATSKALESPIKMVDGILPKPKLPNDESQVPYMRIPEIQSEDWPLAKNRQLLPKISVDPRDP